MRNLFEKKKYIKRNFIADADANIQYLSAINKRNGEKFNEICKFMLFFSSFRSFSLYAEFCFTNTHLYSHSFLSIDDAFVHFCILYKFVIFASKCNKIAFFLYKKRLLNSLTKYVYFKHFLFIFYFISFHGYHNLNK